MKLKKKDLIVHESGAVGTVLKTYLDEIFPNAQCELNYFNDYSFLIAVMLSAQCTDKKVNKVTKVLFEK